MNWNFLAVWIGMKTCDARFGPHQLAVAPRGFALHSCHNVCHAQMCPALLVHTMSSFEKYCPLGLAANWPEKLLCLHRQTLLKNPKLPPSDCLLYVMQNDARVTKREG